jgi:hypothetical protein
MLYTVVHYIYVYTLKIVYTTTVTCDEVFISSLFANALHSTGRSDPDLFGRIRIRTSGTGSGAWP